VRVAERPALPHNAPMPRLDGWTRDQQLIALRLYMRTPFGKLDGRNPEIIALALRIGRTANALAMKACNFASLDPEFRRSGRTGLSGASTADRALWQEFAGNAEQLAAQAEDAFARLDPATSARDEAEVQAPAGETDVLCVVRARRVQSFFRAAVLTSYDHRCAISGLAIPELLVASHIIPWSESVERRADPTNGLCLNALFDRAFDRGLVTIASDLRVVVSGRLRHAAESAELSCSLLEAEGRRVRLPSRGVPPRGARALQQPPSIAPAHPITEV
jgi:putative restriction endonuclease